MWYDTLWCTHIGYMFLLLNSEKKCGYYTRLKNRPFIFKSFQPIAL